MSAVHEPSWHDRAVAAAADAWLSEPRDTVAYQRLVDAVLRRRAWLQPTLDEAPGVDDVPMAATEPRHDDGPELLDELGADRAPVRLGDDLPADPRALVAQLRAGLVRSG